ncbi:MAG TPA: biotin carboxylase N-terminal domain-containing protein [Methanomassiliicoccales archaeon]|nr:biotin carboxylase N-terminal domain-containing protein [Methanomassiliicoccales archaeon]
MFKRLLIANRGEIAIRVIRTCKRLNIPTVAIYTQADQHCKHVHLADKAVLLQSNKPIIGYLDIDAIIDVAKRMSVDAIHPGYGLLSEKAEFPRRCEEEGITFIGPSAKAMSLLGSKLDAREFMEKLGVRTTPGTLKPLSGADEAVREAERIGYPIMLKAAGGGGGRGMRVVERPEDMAEAFEAAQAESTKAFNDPDIFMERRVVKPHHIEFQMVGDSKGNGYCLGERECSIQRRNQKLVEETPSCSVTEEMRKDLFPRIENALEKAGYESLCTFEFLMSQQGELFFMEANTRIQVEHPITEMVTDLDLVEEQLKIASDKEVGEELRAAKPHGAAMEFRVNAENPFNNFFPSPGRIDKYIEPTGEGIRVDSHAYEGYVVPTEYDSLLAKLVVWGRERNETLARAREALDRFTLTGLKTTIPYHRLVVRTQAFRSGRYSTDFVKENPPSELIKQESFALYEGEET